MATINAVRRWRLRKYNRYVSDDMEGAVHLPRKDIQYPIVPLGESAVIVGDDVKDDDPYKLGEIKKVSVGVAELAVRKALPKSSTARVMLRDRNYWTLSLIGWHKILRNAPPRKKYEPDRYDCDDYAAHMRGWVPYEHDITGIGEVLIDKTAKHAYNIVLVLMDDGKVQARFLEPQTDRFVVLGTDHYKLMKGEIVF